MTMPIASPLLRYNGLTRSRILGQAFDRLALGGFSPAVCKEGSQSLAFHPCRLPFRLLVPIIA